MACQIFGTDSRRDMRFIPADLSVIGGDMSCGDHQAAALESHGARHANRHACSSDWVYVFGFHDCKRRDAADRAFELSFEHEGPYIARQIGKQWPK